MEDVQRRITSNLYRLRIMRPAQLMWVELGILLLPAKSRLKGWVYTLIGSLGGSAYLVERGDVHPVVTGIAYGIALFAFVVVLLVVLIFYRNNHNGNR